jgi:hypothetical protein
MTWTDNGDTNSELTKALPFTEKQKSFTSRKHTTVFGLQIWLQFLFLRPGVPPLAGEGCPLSTPQYYLRPLSL